MESKLYILVLKKLSKSQRIAQACHAVAGYLLKYPDSDWKNGTVVILAIDDVEKFANKLSENKKNYYIFQEPYWNMLATSLASPYIGEETKDLLLA